MTNPSNRPAKRGLAMPPAIALISGTQSDNLGIPQGVAGRFTRVNQMNRKNDNTPLSPTDGHGYLNNISSDIEGQANIRDSIPDAKAQYICFETMTSLITDGTVSEYQEIYNQWCGAVCMRILFPFLAEPLRWVSIDVNSMTDPLGKAIKTGLLLNEDEAFQLLVLDGKLGSVPVLQISSAIIAVPSSSCDALEHCGSLLWIKSIEGGKIVFDHPLKVLSLYQLVYVRDWIKGALEQNTISSSNGLKRFVLEVKNRITQLTAEDVFCGIWVNILKGLFLRSIDEMDISIISTKDTQRWDKEFQDLKHPPAYAIDIGGKIVGYLDSEKVFWLQTPGLFETQESGSFLAAYQTLIQKSEACTPNSDFGLLVHHRLSQLTATAFRSESRCLDLKNKYSPSVNRSDRNDISLTPRFGTLKPYEVAFFPSKFSAFNLFTKCHCTTHGDSIFAEYIAIFTDPSVGMSKKTPIFECEKMQEWSSVYQNKKCTDEQAILPLNEFGGSMVNNCLRAKMSIDVKIEKQADRTYRCTVVIKEDGISYLFVHQFDKKNVIIMHDPIEELPEICYWPNICNASNDKPWKLYYTYIRYPHNPPADAEKDMSTFTANIFDADGYQLNLGTWRDFRDQPASPNQAFAPHHWQTCQSQTSPAFCVFHDGAQTIGAVFFTSPKPMDQASTEAYLAIDFGTTATTGAVLFSNDKKIANKQLKPPLFEKAPIAWQMKKSTTAQEWSLDFFIAEGLNLQTSGEKQSESFLSVVGRFPPREAECLDQVHLDAHIHFYGDNIKQDQTNVATIRPGIKLLSFSTHEGGVAAELNQSNLWDIVVFLRQVMQMYFLFCRQKGAAAVELRMSLPLVFQEEKRNKLQELIDDLAKEVAEETGIKLKETKWSTESEAVGVYFSQMPRINAALATEGFVTVDIGGGTTDYAFWKMNGMGSRIQQCYSNLLGGQQIVGDFLWRLKERRLIFAYEDFQTALKNVAGKRKISVGNKAFADFVDHLFVGNDRAKFLFDIDRIVRMEEHIFKDVFTMPAGKALHYLIAFEYSVLFWFACLIFNAPTASFDKTAKERLSLYAAGNGAKFYWILSENLRNDLEEILMASAKDKFSIVPSVGAKREVVTGLLQSDNIFLSRSFGGNDNTNFSVDTLWSEFKNFLKRYETKFEKYGDEECVVLFIHKLFDESEESVEKRFKENVTDMQKLCEYLYEFCAMMKEGIIDEIAMGKYPPRPSKKFVSQEGFPPPPAPMTQKGGSECQSKETVTVTKPKQVPGTRSKHTPKPSSN